MADREDLSGRKIGEFLLRERIDEGGFGEVYVCEQATLGREAVIKVMHAKLRRTDVAVQRFMREAQLASRLDHPYAAHVYKFGVDRVDGLFWIAMERVHGITLARWLTTHGPMPLGQLVSFFENIAKVVQTAHEYGIVHRDLKPSNVMVIKRARELLPKLLDFGVAKLLDGAVPEGTPEINYRYPPSATDDQRSPVSMVRGSDTAPDPGNPTRLTQNDQTVGSPPYMSPEQWDNPVTVGPASDLYSLAVLAFEALTGRRPFHATVLTDYAELHRRSKVPPLGSNFPPALDRMFQRALAKRPEDRWGTALELADALRSASGLGSVQADLPRIDESVRDAWLGAAPQPLAESIAALDNACNAFQARDAAQALVRNLLRYLLSLAIATWSQEGGDQDDPLLLDLVRALGKRELIVEERLQLLRLLVRPRTDHPVPELVDLAALSPAGPDALAPIERLYSIADNSNSEDSLRTRLRTRIPELSQLLHRARCLLDYVLVVPRGNTAERWTGRRQEQRAIVAVRDGEIVEGHPMLLDRDGRICVDLWPLVQAESPSVGAPPELFVFDGRGHHSARLIAGDRGIARDDDSAAWHWVTTHLIAEVEAKARMRDQIRTAGRQWQDQGRPRELLWRGRVLAQARQWMRGASAGAFGESERAFIVSSLEDARRTRRALVATAALIAIAGLTFWVVMHGRVVEQEAADRVALAQEKARAAEQLVTQAHVEQGRAALLYGKTDEAQRHLTEAHQRDDHSPSTEFMLSRAMQSRLAEQARFTSCKGRMWSAIWSPDGRQIVTTDDACARVWDAKTHRLLLTLSHGDEVYNAVYTVDGARIVTVTSTAVKVWGAIDGSLVRELRHARSDSMPTDYFMLAVSHNGRIVAATDARGAIVHVWDVSTGALRAELHNDAAEFPSLQFSADDRYLATSGGNDVRVFDTNTWTKTTTIPGPRIHTLRFDPTGLRLATGSATGDASIWKVPTGTRVHHLREIGDPVDAVAFSPDGELVVTASRDGAEQVWHAGSGTLQSQGNYLRGKIHAVEFDRSSKLVLSAGTSGTVVVADALQGMPVSSLEGSGGAVWVAHFDRNSRRVVGASLDGTAHVWDATPPYRRWNSPPVSDDCGTATSLVPDQRFIAIGCGGLSTRIWDTAHDRLLAELPSVTQVEGDFTSAFPAVSADGERAAIARGNTVEIYDIYDFPGRLLRTVVHPAAVNAVAFAPAGYDLVSGAVDGSLLVTRDDGHDPIALIAFIDGIDVATILADGRVVAAAGTQLRVYDPAGDTVLATLEMPVRVGSLRASQDGARLVAISLYTTSAATPPMLWDLERYRPIVQLDGHTGRVFAARFVGSTLLTSGGDRTVRQWDAATGRPLQLYRGDARFSDATIDPYGLRIVAAGADGLLWFWDATSGLPLWTLQAHKSAVIGIHFEGVDLVTRGVGGDVARWTISQPRPERPGSVIMAR